MKPLFQKRVGIGVKASGLIFVCVILVSVDASTLWLKSFKALAGTALEPVLMISQWPNQAADSFSDFFTTRKTLRDEIEKLNRQILMMRTSSQKMAALLQENNRLRQLLKLLGLILTQIMLGSPLIRVPATTLPLVRRLLMTEV